MSRRRWSVLAAVPAVLIATVVPMMNSGAADAATQQSAGITRHISKASTTRFTPRAAGSGAYTSRSTEIASREVPDGLETPGSARGLADPTTASARLGTTGGIIRRPQLVRSFSGLNFFDQRTANGGNQFSTEPPDQGLCVGAGHIVEVVNDVIRVYNADGTGQTGIEDLNTFFGYPAQINRSTGVIGPDVFDPTCLYDPTTRHFFLVANTLGTAPNGDLTGKDEIDIAVTGNPTGAWNIFRLDVTDDGTNGTPVHPHCPCLGDYPHIGVDAHGFFLTTNEFSIFGPQFNSAQIYAFSKRALARGDTRISVTQLDTTGADQRLPGFTVWPAQSPSTSDYATAAGGTEYFLSSIAIFSNRGVGRSLTTWAVTNTRSLDWNTPRVQLRDSRAAVHRYTVPPVSEQKRGPVPLATCLNTDSCATILLGSPDPYKPEVEGVIDSNDSRMQQVTFANGKLYGALDSGVTVGGTEQAGIGWYILMPTVTGNSVRASVVRQGMLGLAGNNLDYPAIGITAAGHGVMAFTLVGRDFYPSAAYSSFDGARGAGGIFVAARGKGPQDGFTEYKVYGTTPGVPDHRWGDYGASAVAGNSVWIASEYIGQRCTYAEYVKDMTCGDTRAPLGNWDTRISQIQP